MEDLTEVQKLVKNSLSCLERDSNFLKMSKEEICHFHYEEIGEMHERLCDIIFNLESVRDAIEDI